MKRYRITFALLACLVAIGVFFFTNKCINLSNQNAQLFQYGSKEAALIDGISQKADASMQQKHPLENIILSTEYNGSVYVIIKALYNENEISKDCVYVAAVKEKNDQFAFIKLTPDISLDTIGDTKDLEYTPNEALYFDDIEGLYFAVGKIYDGHYKPYFNGSEIQLLNGNMYAFVQEKERPHIDILKVY